MTNLRMGKVAARWVVAWEKYGIADSRSFTTRKEAGQYLENARAIRDQGGRMMIPLCRDHRDLVRYNID